MQIHSTGLAVLDLARLSDDIAVNGTMSRNHLIVPSTKTVWNWFLSVYDTSDMASSQEERILMERGTQRMADDIEHLPPRNTYERFGVKVRKFQMFLRGPELSFGFRSAW